MKNQIHILTLMLLFTCGMLKAQSVFDINDPRNPNCPCHQHQKLADEEYRQMQASADLHKTGSANIGKQSNLYSVSSSLPSEKNHSKHHIILLVSKSRKASHRLKKNWQRSVFYSCFRKIKRSVKTDLCYHWR